MIKHVGNERIDSLFNSRASRMFLIPKYQREYTWGKKQQEILFNDIVGNEQGYFLGSIICVNDAVTSGNEYEIIDGQQRLTTLSLLLLAVYNQLKEMKDKFKDDDDLLTAYTSIRQELMETATDKDGNKISYPRIRLQEQCSNRADYEFLLRENTLQVGSSSRPKKIGNRRICLAYNYFLKRINAYLEDLAAAKGIAELMPNQKFGALFELANKFNSSILVTIEVDTHKDAYMLFESLNNRGVPLSAVDLIKNLLIAQADVNKSSDKAYEEWKTLLSYLGDDYVVQERFFRQYYNAFRDELNKPYFNVDSGKKYPLGYLATKTTLLDIYERLIKDDYKSFLTTVSKAAENYAVIINNSNGAFIFQQALENLERIQGAPSYLLLLYLLENKDALSLNDNIIKAIVELLTKFFVRRNITDIPNTRNLVKIFMDIVEMLRGHIIDDVYDIIRNKLVGVSSDEKLFEEKLRGPIYQDNDMATRFILCQIEAIHQTKEIYSDFWLRDKNKNYIWTIEHIFPEGEHIPKAWVDMIADGNYELAQEYQERYVHTLGNLTLTGYNQNLSNLSFGKKKNRTNKDGTKDVGYKNGLFLNKNVITKEQWTVEDIQERTNNIVDVALKIFKL